MKKLVTILIFISILTTTALANNDFVRVNNGALYKGNDEIVLNGVNLGGWLIMESWLSPFFDPCERMAYTDIINILEKRFGKKRADELIKLHEENFITEYDFKQIKQLGFNCVRIPFWYRNFYTKDGVWKENVFAVFDFALEMCEKYGLYAILDMHGCPGGQSMNHSTGIIGNNGLYGNKTNMERMEKIWTEIAKRYKNNPYLLAYDIMNEPQNNSGFTGPRAWSAESEIAIDLTIKVYDKMIKAIRNIDDRHIISVEGVWRIDTLPDPQKYNWENMMYQLHIYDKTKADINQKLCEFIYAREKWRVAVLSGEYNSGNLEGYASRLYNTHKISRIKWTYKTFGDNGNWGLYNKMIDKVDINKIGFSQLKELLSNDSQTNNGFIFNENEYTLIN